MNFNDILKSSFLEKAVSVSVFDMAIALILSFAIGLFILYIYKKTFSGVIYSKSFSVLIVVMSVITTIIILAITSNVVLSLGMVGALSIVRFRTAVKEPLDIGFLFWSISSGIVVGAGLFPLAVIGSLFVGIMLLFLTKNKTKETPYIVVISVNGDETEKDVMTLIKEQTKKHIVKTKSISANGIELTIEVRLQNANVQFVNDLLKVSGVANATLVSYNGDYLN